MKKELSKEALEELSFMRDWNWEIADFLVKNEKAEFFKELYPVITETFDKKNLRGMRMMYNDSNEMARSLSPHKLNELNKILREKFGFDLNKAHDKVLAKINRIVQRGHLKNDDEFRLLCSRVDEIYADDSKEKEVEILERLMGDYEERKAAKMLKKRSLKKAILSSLLIVFICGCTTTYNTEKIKELNDSITHALLIHHDDSLLLSRVLPLCDSIIALDNEKHKYNHMMTKCQVLWTIGRYEEALDEGTNAANLLPPNHIARLGFYGFKYKFLDDTLQSNKYYLQALSECEKEIANNNNRYIKEKAIILIQMGKANEAKEILKQANRDFPDDQEIKTLLVGFD